MVEKIAKLHNIEDYTIKQIDTLIKLYQSYVKDHDNTDIDYPNIKFKSNND